ncbi:MAG: hypothetical protein AB1451_14330 [Nitrospirota bacterium]
MAKIGRIKRLANPGGGTGISFSADLLLAAKLMLEYSLEDRKDNATPPLDNHMSKHSIGSIVLLIAGLESWLNEALAHLSTYDPTLRTRGKDTLLTKYKYLCSWDGAGRIALTDIATLARAHCLNLSQINDDLKLVIEVRNEIVHPMPFGTGSPWNVPNDFLRLHHMGLLMTTGKPDEDYAFNAKLRSYALAYWCWEVTETAVSLLVKHFEPDQLVAWTAPNFSQYKSLCPPKDLANYGFP